MGSFQVTVVWWSSLTVAPASGGSFGGEEAIHGRFARSLGTSM
jgi:hypothetical protein